MNLGLCYHWFSGSKKWEMLLRGTQGPIRKEWSPNQTAAGTQKVDVASGTYLPVAKLSPTLGWNKDKSLDCPISESQHFLIYKMRVQHPPHKSKGYCCKG